MFISRIGIFVQSWIVNYFSEFFSCSSGARLSNFLYPIQSFEDERLLLSLPVLTIFDQKINPQLAQVNSRSLMQNHSHLPEHRIALQQYYWQ